MFFRGKMTIGETVAKKSRLNIIAGLISWLAYAGSIYASNRTGNLKRLKSLTSNWFNQWGKVKQSITRIFPFTLHLHRIQANPFYSLPTMQRETWATASAVICALVTK
jgi:hypothetical protein